MFVKHSEKTQCVFGGDLINLNIVPRKETGSHTYTSRAGWIVGKRSIPLLRSKSKSPPPPRPCDQSVKKSGQGFTHVLRFMTTVVWCLTMGKVHM
jgi:hypothetical protein